MFYKKILAILFLSFMVNTHANADEKKYLCSQPGAKISVKNQYLYVRTACTYEQLTKGLNINDLTTNSGLLYVFNKEGTFSFWTKYTPMPVDIIYLNNNLEIVDIGSLKPSSDAKISNKNPASYVLEVNFGWAKQNNIQIGDKIEVFHL